MSADRDFGGRYYRARALTPAQAHAVAASLQAGVAPSELATAYGVSKRTIYRYADRGREAWHRVVVGEWAAEFVMTEYGPVRCTAWVPA